MAALLRGLRVARTLRGLGSVTVCVPTAVRPRRAFLCAPPRLQDHNTPTSSSFTPTPTPSSSSSSTTSQELQADSAEQQEAAASPEEVMPEEESTGDSSQQEEEDEDFETEEQLKVRLLTAALDFVPQHGWTMEAIAAGAESLGLSSASTGMFTNGGGDLVLHFVAHCNTQLTQILTEQHNQEQLGHAQPKEMADFLRDAVETRLRMLIPFIDKWPQAMSILVLPHNIPHSLQHLATMVDDIWYYAGDRSTDVNWYTKRAVLTAIYNTTELVMVQDPSPDFQDTWRFLENRIQDAANMATTAKQVQSTGEAVVQGLMGAAVTLKNLTGMNQRR